ncbi:ParB/RepB/Spo0J family partition protein [Nocardioides cavernaquae]|uniref:ParB/RepB/Spo0J family partition protein n=1 Tax=Nocardioides cavernaquae TaxID=2321396 RepID=A0A3A5H514_9ACTN|nr:ParB/RepB/Spo0J family partition protein [Nocardioides cavernaquae]RJS45793.1 ParB/RepB/Spo0J family partition protein [Nocardioides cavernaquae]
MNDRQPQRRGLGRGLGALIPTAPVDDEVAPAPIFPKAPPSTNGNGSTSDAGAQSAPDAPAAGTTGSQLGTGSSAATTAPDAAGGAGGSGANGEGGRHAAVAGGVIETGAYFAELPITQITPNQWQPRQVFEEEALAELVHSIREIGLLQPIVVRESGPGTFELIMGERRWRASQEAGLDRIPAIVRQTEDDDMLRDALLENLHRSQLNSLEEAAAYRQLLDDFGCTHDELATRIGRSRPQISNTLRLLKLSPAVQRRVAAGVLSAGHARSLLAVEDAEIQDRLAQRVVAEGISVRGLEEIVAVGEHGRGGQRTQRRKPVAPGLDDISERLSDRLETRVKVELGKSKGKITIEFASLDDLRRIVDVVDPRNRHDRPI